MATYLKRSYITSLTELLQPEEEITRSDLAVVWIPKAGLSGLWRTHACFRMTITERRIIWSRPADRRYVRMLFESFRPALTSAFENFGSDYRAGVEPWSYTLELCSIKALWKWQPEFSAPPMIQTFDATDTGINFAVLQGEYPHLEHAPIEAVREHFSVLERAWIAARERAPSPQAPLPDAERGDDAP
jgi:hypothetical protein